MALDYGNRQRRPSRRSNIWPPPGFPVGGSGDDSSALDIARSGPPSTSSGGSGSEDRWPRDPRAPLGVPRGHRVVTQRDMTGMSARAAEGWAASGVGHGAAVTRGPRYFDGDEWKPGNMDPAGIAALQQQLAAGGYLTGDWAWQRWDEKSRNAYKDLLSEANASGIDAESLLTERMNTPGAGAEGTGPGGREGRWSVDGNGNPVFVPEPFVPPDALPVRLPSRDDMRAVTREVVTDRLGQGWSGEQIEEFIDRYYAYAQGQAQGAYEAEVERQRAAFETGQPVSSVNVELDVAAPETSLDEELRRTQPDAYAAGQVAEYADSFFTALGGYT